MRVAIFLLCFLSLRAESDAQENRIVLPKISTLCVEFSNSLTLDRQIAITRENLDEPRRAESLSKLAVPQRPVIDWEKIITVVPESKEQEITMQWQLRQEYRGNLTGGKWKFELASDPVVTELKSSIPDQIASSVAVLNYGKTTEKIDAQATECCNYLIIVGLNQPAAKWNPKLARLTDEITSLIKSGKKFDPSASRLFSPAADEKLGVGFFVIRWKSRANGTYEYQQEALRWLTIESLKPDAAEKSRADWSKENPRTIPVPDVQHVFPAVGPTLKF